MNSYTLGPFLNSFILLLDIIPAFVISLFMQMIGHKSLLPILFMSSCFSSPSEIASCDSYFFSYYISSNNSGFPSGPLIQVSFLSSFGNFTSGFGQGPLTILLSLISVFTTFYPALHFIPKRLYLLR